MTISVVEVHIETLNKDVSIFISISIYREMEAYKKVMIVGMLLTIANVTMLVNGDQTFCHTTKAGLDSCKPYVNGDNSVDKQNPSSDCCSVIAKADLQCLCRYKNYLPLYGIDPEQAMKLPVNCKLMNSFHC
jgi:hypothetical protein